MEQIILLPEYFEVLLLTSKSSLGPLLTEWRMKYEERSLPVGNLIWIVRNASEKKGLLLPYIIVHYRYDRFACSIKDGDLHDLKVSNIRLKHINNVKYQP